MLTRLKHPDAHLRMAKARHHRPVMVVLGWAVYPIDGRALLFKGNRGRSADWFEFCMAVRRLLPGGVVSCKQTQE